MLIPKSEEPAELALAASVLEKAGSTARLAALIESARGVARAAEIAERTPRLAVLIFGAADYAADLGQQVGAFQPDFARAAVVNAAAAGGIAAIDSPFFALDEPEQLGAECQQGARPGLLRQGRDPSSAAGCDRCCVFAHTRPNASSRGGFSKLRRTASECSTAG